MINFRLGTAKECFSKGILGVNGLGSKSLLVSNGESSYKQQRVLVGDCGFVYYVCVFSSLVMEFHSKYKDVYLFFHSGSRR